MDNQENKEETNPEEKEQKEEEEEKEVDPMELLPNRVFTDRTSVILARSHDDK